MRIALFTPKYDRSCSDCLKYLYTSAGVLERHPITGEPDPRPATIPTPCMSCPKPPTWARKAGKDEAELRELAKPYDITPENRLAYAYYQTCAATGSFPDDAIVRWYAGIIRELEVEWSRQPSEQSFQAVKFLCELLMRGR